MHSTKALRTRAALLAAMILLPAAPAAGADGIARIESRPLSELWINPGLYSLHFERNKGLNNENWGLGVEYRYSTVSAVTAGYIENSDRRTSRYAGWYWQPIAAGPLRLGGVAGAMDGYPNFRDGGWFPVIIPAASLEYRRLGVNVLVIPSYKDRLHGALSVQLKLKVY